MNVVNQAAGSRLFAYGTLALPEIWKLVTQSTATAIPTTLAGYRRFRVRGADYPGIIATENSEDFVDGCLYADLDGEVMRRLDHYEDDFYERIEVSVETADDAELACHTYVVPSSRKEVLCDEDWTLDWFRTHAQRRFLERLGLGN